MHTDFGPTLLPIARAAIAQALGRTHAVDTSAPWLQKNGATFVTLMLHGQLHGCIGSLQSWRPLAEDVQANAVAAATRDPRFAPLTAAQFDQTQISVSLLSPMQPLPFASQADALAQLRPGIDGIVLQFDGHRGTFLPQVWEQLPTADTFMAQLIRKAGLPADFWSDRIRLQRYSVAKWEESNAPASGTRRTADSTGIGAGQ
ncbi:MAG: AmmeMemoRadiSam system protein A [Betaproteobacteria bacterium]